MRHAPLPTLPTRPARPAPPGGPGRAAAVWMGLVAVLLAAAPAPAQTASVTVDRDRVAVDDEVLVEVTVQGGRGRGVEPPKATCCLRLESPRPVFDASSTVNGETERTVAWLYRATRPGSAQILPLRVEVGGQALRTRPLKVEVAAPPPAPAPADLPAGDLFVRAEPQRTTAVVGQQVLVDYVLYFDPSVQPRQTTPTGTWDAPGAWREELDVPPAYPRSVQRGGQTLEAVTIRRVALFPTRTGALDLAAMDFAIDLFRTRRPSSNDPFAPFFQPFSSTFDEQDVTAPALSVAVRALPGGAPPSFDGAVGQFEIASRIEPRRVAAGEPVRVELTLSGTGNLATLAPPALDVPPGVDVYDADEAVEWDRKASPLRGRKTFTYTLVPQSGGSLDLPPAVWSYFDPSDGRYKTLRSDAATIEVDGPALAARPDTDEVVGGLMTEADWRPASRPTGWLWGALGAGLTLPLLGALGLVVVRGRRQRAAADTTERRRARARPEVERRLLEARSLDGPAFFAALDAAVRQFLSDHVGVPAATQSRPALRSALADRGVPTDALDRVDAVLADAERGQFAPGGGPDRDAVLREAEQALDDLAAFGGTSPRRRWWTRPARRPGS